MKYRDQTLPSGMGKTAEHLLMNPSAWMQRGKVRFIVSATQGAMKCSGNMKLRGARLAQKSKPSVSAS